MSWIEHTMSGASEDIARRAKAAFYSASRAVPSGNEGDKTRCSVLYRLRSLLDGSRTEVQKANETDVAKAKDAGMSPSLIARLDLFSKPGKWQGMLDGIEQVAALPNPLEQCTIAKRLANGNSTDKNGNLDLYRITCPIGVLLCIFEARPEVIINIACLSIKSGNAAILKGGKESTHTAAVLSKYLRQALDESNALPSDLIQTVETRQDVAGLLNLDQHIDLVIPRGSNELVRSIQKQSSIPVMGHADGLCCAYVHEDAVASLVPETIVDAKTDYPAACNALETILVHKQHLQTGLVKKIVQALISAKVTVHATEEIVASLDATLQNDTCMAKAKQDDFDTEYLSLDVAIKTVDSLDEAVDHINSHGSHHTDVIFTAPVSGETSGSETQNQAAATFVRAVDSANVFVNASTRFSDGFRYGFGTEVGISTGKIHARGPVGLEGLVTYKYVIQGHDSQQTCGAFTSNTQGQEPRSFVHTDLPKRYPPL